METSTPSISIDDLRRALFARSDEEFIRIESRLHKLDPTLVAEKIKLHLKKIMLADTAQGIATKNRHNLQRRDKFLTLWQYLRNNMLHEHLLEMLELKIELSSYYCTVGGISVLSWAAKYGNAEIMTLLLEPLEDCREPAFPKVEKIDQTLLYEAVDRENIEVIKVLLTSTHYDIGTDSMGYIPYSYEELGDSEPRITSLVDLIRISSNLKMTALFAAHEAFPSLRVTLVDAVYKADIEMVKSLLQSKQSAVLLAIKTMPVFNDFIVDEPSKGISQKCVNHEVNALQLAVMRGEKAIVEAILAAGIFKVNEPSGQLLYPLNVLGLAVIYKQPAILSLLLKDAKDKMPPTIYRQFLNWNNRADKLNVFHLALKAGDHECIRLLHDQEDIVLKQWPIVRSECHYKLRCLLNEYEFQYQLYIEVLAASYSADSEVMTKSRCLKTWGGLVILYHQIEAAIKTCKKVGEAQASLQSEYYNALLDTGFKKRYEEFDAPDVSSISIFPAIESVKERTAAIKPDMQMGLRSVTYYGVPFSEKEEFILNSCNKKLKFFERFLSEYTIDSNLFELSQPISVTDTKLLASHLHYMQDYVAREAQLGRYKVKEKAVLESSTTLIEACEALEKLREFPRWLSRRTDQSSVYINMIQSGPLGSGHVHRLNGDYFVDRKLVGVAPTSTVPFSDADTRKAAAPYGAGAGAGAGGNPVP